MPLTNIGFSSIEQMQAQYFNKNATKTDKTGDMLSFDNILAKQIEANNRVKFSKHATERLESRNIELSEEQIGRIEEGLNKAKQKGITDSLMLIDDIALVVNVPNNTVITAVNSEERVDNVFTNIDGAVIV